MPISPWYDVSRDVGQPAFIQFWEGFIGVRSKINQQIMAERLAASDPTKLLALEKGLRDNITDLQAKRADVIKATIEQSSKLTQGQWKIVERIIAAEAAVEAAGVTGSYGLAGKRVQAEADVFGHSMQDTATRRERAAAQLADPAIVGTIGDGLRAAAQTGNPAEYTTRFNDLARGMPDGLARDQLAVQMVELAEKNGLQSSADGVRAAAGMTPQDNPQVWRDTRANLAGTEEAHEMGREVASAPYSGGGSLSDLGGRVVGTLRNMGWADKDIGAVAESFTKQGGAITTSAPQAGGAGVGIATGGGAYGDQLKKLDDQIQQYNDDLKSLQAQRAVMKQDSFFSGFMGNALLETQFIVPPRDIRPHIDALNTLKPEEQKLMGQLLEEAGGDPGKALELFRSGSYGSKLEVGEEIPVEETKEPSPYAPPPDVQAAQDAQAAPAEEVPADQAAAPAKAAPTPPPVATPAAAPTSQPKTAPTAQAAPQAQPEPQPAPQVNLAPGDIRSLMYNMQAPQGAPEPAFQMAAPAAAPVVAAAAPSEAEDVAIIAQFKAKKNAIDAIEQRIRVAPPEERIALTENMVNLANEMTDMNEKAQVAEVQQQTREAAKAQADELKRVAQIAPKIKAASELVGIAGGPFSQQQTDEYDPAAGRKKTKTVPNAMVPSIPTPDFMAWNERARASGVEPAVKLAELREQAIRTPSARRQLEPQIAQQAAILLKMQEQAQNYGNIAAQELSTATGAAGF